VPRRVEDAIETLDYHPDAVARGYIPKRGHSQSSYAPILPKEGRSGQSLGMDLRAGNIHPSVGRESSWPALSLSCPRRWLPCAPACKWTERFTTGRSLCPFTHATADLSDFAKIPNCVLPKYRRFSHS
jgi:hypothetical protein